MPQSVGALRASILVIVAAFSTLAVGLLIFAGGPVRFSTPGFATARGIAPWWGWAAAMVLAGLLATVGAIAHRMWMARIGHSLASLVYFFLVTTFIVSAYNSPTTALTGIGIYTGFAALHAFAAASADLERTTHDANEVTRESRARFDAAMRDD